MKNLPYSIQGIILAITGYSIFAFTDVCLKTTSQHYDPFAVGLYMNIFTTLFLIPIALKTRGLRRTLSTPTLKNHFVRSMFMLCNFLCVIYAIGNLPIATFYVIIFLYPFVVSILSTFILNERITFSRWFCIALALSGVLIALRPDIITITLPVIIAFVSCFFNASATISVKFINKTDHWLSYPLYLMIFQTPIIVALMIFFNIPLLPEFTAEMLFWFVLGGLVYTVGLTIMPQALQRIDASLVGAMFFIIFPWGVLYGYFIFDDIPDRWTLLGAVIIIGSGLFLIYKEHIINKRVTTKNTKRTKTSC